MKTMPIMKKGTVLLIVCFSIISLMSLSWATDRQNRAQEAQEKEKMIEMLVWRSGNQSDTLLEMQEMVRWIESMSFMLNFYYDLLQTGEQNISLETLSPYVHTIRIITDQSLEVMDMEPNPPQIVN